MYFLAYLNSEVPDKNTLKTGLFTHPKRLLIPSRGLCGQESAFGCRCGEPWGLTRRSACEVQNFLNQGSGFGKAKKTVEILGRNITHFLGGEPPQLA
jgi:hypothetical protein